MADTANIRQRQITKPALQQNTQQGLFIQFTAKPLKYHNVTTTNNAADKRKVVKQVVTLNTMGK